MRGGKPELLWTGSIRNGNIEMDLTDYQYFIFITKTSETVDSKPRAMSLVKKGVLGWIACNFVSGQGTYQTIKRVESNDSGFTILTTPNANYGFNNIPIYIFGIKDDFDLEDYIN